jgi:NADH dehydrogenase [ubiquinone] 1 alpha subcomplex assembly factor 7
MSPLTTKIIDIIRRDGPLPVSAFMAMALLDDQYGYYTTRDPFGAAGDFITAPEISQMFGELIGLWAAVMWQSMGSPDRVVLAEVGPGRGTLMADMLRAAAMVPPFAAAIAPWLIEASPTLRRKQAEALSGHDIHWGERVEDLPPGPLLLIANEFFDALPIDQIVRTPEGWRERRVGLDETGALTFVNGPAFPLPEAEDGAIAEICPEGRRLAAVIGRRLATQNGAALIIDYGHGRSGFGDTLQAVRQHRPHPVLAEIGEADLTAHVDFEALAHAAVPARAWGPVGQGDFLRHLGIEARAARLSDGKPHAVAADILGRMHRLIDATEMGTLFKVMALTHPALPAPPGL